ncbi:larval cuticle protein A2B-like isoform X1 [Chrysoperla carnea]|uniref:larval cuticle protein A2B-like isoform X1 n=1 Tax=Chrysoperla carnea TaxID=189513 RepID=UPI001D06DAB4|nr:larval cuticle protein A2B-like isoform X1 [Chrysoperla carnea]
MFCQLLVCTIALATYVNAGALPVAAPVAAAPVLAKVEEYDPHPQYSFAYNINDALTGDAKNQQEIREGDFVKGSYSLIEPDGTRRTVNYIADPVNGFNAIVNREPAAALVRAAPVVAAAPAPVVAAPAPVVAAPAARYFAAPAPVVAPAPVAAPAPVFAARYAVSPAGAAVALPGYARFAAAPYTFPAPAAPFAAAYVR